MSAPVSHVAPAAQRMFAEGEGRKILLLAFSMCSLAHLRRRVIRRRWLSKDQAEDDEKCHTFVDHPAVVYLMENAACFGLAYLLERFYPVGDPKRPLYSFLVTIIKGWLMVNPLLLFEKFSAAYLYSHVKYFSAKRPAQDLATLATEYLRCNFPVDFFNSILQVAILMGLPEKRVEALVLNPPPMRVVPLLTKYVLSRVAVDVSFGILHRLMHENAWIYDNVHRTHHEHTTPRTQTNLHFTWIDQFFEAVVPIYLAFGVLEMLGQAPSRREMSFLTVPLLYYESCSHSGKEVPIVTWIPFASPLVDWLTGCDQRLVEYHTRHHQLYRCNYSISPWWDKWLGTYRIDLPDGYNTEGSYE